MITQLRLLLLFFAIIKFSDIYSQQQEDLMQMDFYSINQKIEENQNNQNVFLYLKAYLEKAKKEDNLTKIIKGYKNYIFEVEYGQKLIYADSMILTAELTKNNEEIGSAILTKGIVFYSENELTKALDSYLTANKLLVSSNNDYLKYKTQYNIAHVKYYLGFYNEAVSLFLKCSDFFKNNNTRAYLNCLHSLSLCYTRLGNYRESAGINSLAIKESNISKDFSMVPYLNQSSGINDYFSKSYEQGLPKIKMAIPELQKQKDFGNLSVAYFYIASIYWDTGKKELALPYLLKVDKIFTDKKYIRPDLRKNYEMILDYYKNKGDRDSQLVYNNKLIEADKILIANFGYLPGKIFKEYDTARLIAENKEMRQEAKYDKAIRIAFPIFSILLLLILVFFIYKYTLLKKYRENFENYKKHLPQVQFQGSSKKQRPNIPENLEEELIKKLTNFETSFGYLKKDMKIEKLAVSFGTNYKYLSQVVNYNKGMSYPDYISNLRILYIMKKLEEEPKLRNYTNGALAEEAGFGTTQQFVSSFKSIAGMSLDFFIKQIEK